jgi:hypothetical protein
VIAIVIVYFVLVWQQSPGGVWVGYGNGMGMVALLGPESGIFLYRIVGLYPGHDDRERGLLYRGIQGINICQKHRQKSSIPHVRTTPGAPATMLTHQ